MSQSIKSAVLAGGASTRMGVNKALLRLAPAGKTVVESVIARLVEAGAKRPLIVTNTPDEYAFLGLTMVPDDIPGAGPLGGIVTALNHAGAERVLVVACDMPFLSPALLRYMLSVQLEADALVPRWRDEQGRERVETLHAIYSRACIEPARERIAAGELKLRDFLRHIRVQYVEEDVLRRYDPALESFRNINTPQDWARLDDGSKRRR